MAPRRLHLALGLVVAVPALLLATPPAAEAQQVPCEVPVALCPDLIVDPQVMRRTVRFETRTFGSGSCDVVEGHVPGPGTYKLLRFSFTTPNVGTADLYVGDPRDHPEWFEYSACHGHYHFREYADYRLWKPAGYAEWVALRAALPTMLPEEIFDLRPALRDQFVAGHKQGFCVIDLVDFLKLGGGRYFSCWDQGISVGWADEYHSSLSGQWIVVSGVPPGDYVLEAEVNSERVYAELDYANNGSGVPVKVP